jgi:hypothetical protein
VLPRCMGIVVAWKLPGEFHFLGYSGTPLRLHCLQETLWIQNPIDLFKVKAVVLTSMRNCVSHQSFDQSR